jgi:hypothetical protein
MTPAELDELKMRPGNGCAEVAARYVALRRHGRGYIGPCPVCSADRQDRHATRFEIKADGGWVCAVCNDGGDVIALVMRAEGVDFLRAVEILGGRREADAAAQAARERERAAEEARRAAEAEKYRERERSALYRMWRQAADPRGTPVEAYLAHRGLPLPPWPEGGARLRYVADMPYFHGQSIDAAGRRQPRIVHRGPAMTAAIVKGGRFAGMHITWLDPAGGGKACIADAESGEALPAKKVRGSKTGGAIELVKAASAQPHRIIIGEGIETVLTVWHAMRACAVDLSDAEFWSAVDLGNLGGRSAGLVVHPELRTPTGRPRRVPGPDPDLTSSGITLPEGVSEITVLVDGDSDPVTTIGAVCRAAVRFQAAHPGLTVQARFPRRGMDFNDMLRSAI